MALDVHVLGTASARPTPDRAVSGSLVKGPDGIAVIDAGEGFQTRYGKQRRRLKAHSLGETLKPRNVDVLAFTHGHLDHTWGSLPWLQSMDLENRQQPLLILGPTSSDSPRRTPEGHSRCRTTSRPPTSLGSGWRGTRLGGSGLRFPVRWVLGVVGEPALGRGGPRHRHSYLAGRDAAARGLVQQHPDAVAHHPHGTVVRLDDSAARHGREV